METIIFGTYLYTRLRLLVMFRACRHLCSSMKYREQLAILQVAVDTTHLQTRSARTSRRQVTPRFETKSDVVDNQISHSLGLQHSLNVDYEYFKRIGNAVRKLDEAQLDGINMSVPFKNDTPAVVHSAESELLVEPYLQSYTPVLPEQSFNLAPYVNESETLSNLVKLGVDLSKIENDSMVANALVKMDFSREVKPLLLFLHRIGVTDGDIGKCITKCPGILRESLEDMQVRVNYLESKKFSLEAIAKVVLSQPMILMLATKDADAQLGYLQKDFKLNGDEVRQVVAKYPKIVLWSKSKIKDVKLQLKDFLGFSEPELKELLLVYPRLYTSDKHALTKRFNYLHNVIGYSHSDLVHNPQALRTRTTVLRQRHLFLKLLRRDNFDSTRENYVSPKSLSTGRDIEFCDRVAKVSVKQFNDFMKTL